jgi:hypothetical protein
MVMQKVSCGWLLNNAVAVRLLQLGARAVAVVVPVPPAFDSNAWKWRRKKVLLLKKKDLFFTRDLSERWSHYCFLLYFLISTLPLSPFFWKPAPVHQHRSVRSRALSLFDECLAKSRRVLGHDHPDTLETLNNIGALFFKKDDYCRALLHFEDCLARYVRALGSDHPDTKGTRDWRDACKRRISSRLHWQCTSLACESCLLVGRAMQWKRGIDFQLRIAQQKEIKIFNEWVNQVWWEGEHTAAAALEWQGR